jgi:tetratricopeptide (TPR) repeat protein
MGEERSAATAEQLAKGASLGRYVVLGLIGRGGMGEVYAAYDPELNRKIAIKLLKAGGSDAAATTRGRQRLLREAQAIARLSHPNVVVVHDVGTFDDVVFIAMEFVEGQTLGDWLQSSKRSWREVLEVYIAAGRGLAAAHAAGLVHRDFKPDNVMITSSGQVRVMDFGLARDLDTATDPADGPERAGSASGDDGASPSVGEPEEKKLTRTGAMLGTPAYMSPEQFSGGSTDARTDQFSFAVALWEGLHGRRPFAGDNVIQLMVSVVAGEVREPPASSHVPASIRKVLLRGLSVDRNQRYPSMDALLADLGRDPAARRRRWIAAAVGLVLLAATGAGARRLGSDRRALCANGPERAATAWGPERRLAVERAFTASGNPNAARVFATTAALIDAYLGRWTRLYADTCEATHVRGEQSGEVLDLRMDCLGERLSSVRALGDVLSSADARVVDNAVAAATELPMLDRCSDVAMLRAVVRPPDDPATRARVEALRQDVAKVRALFASGQCERAAVAGEKLVEAASALAYQPLRAEALLAVGHLGEDCSDPAKAAESAEEASFAAEMSHHDQIVVEAAGLLAVLYGERMNDLATARRWLRHGEVVLARLPEHPALEAQMAVSRSILFLRTGQTAAAVGESRRALVLLEKVHGPDNSLVAIGLQNLGNALYEDGQLAEAQSVTLRGLQMTRKLYGDDNASAAAILLNQAEILMGLGRLDEARASIDEALAIWRKQHANSFFIGYGLLDRGRLELAAGDARRAQATLFEAGSMLGKENPQLSAELSFELARASWAAPTERGKALAQARQAREAMVATKDSLRKLREVDAWLAAHGAATR